MIDNSLQCPKCGAQRYKTYGHKKPQNYILQI